MSRTKPNQLHHQNSSSSIIIGGLPPKPMAQRNADPVRKVKFIDGNSQQEQDPSLVTNYPLLRRILQSRKLLSDSINLRGNGTDGFNIEVSNPNLKYELLEYLVTENEEADAVALGRDRGGRGRLIRDCDQAFNEMGMIIVSKRENNTPKFSQQSPISNYGSPHPSSEFDDWTRLKNQSIRALGQRRIQFRSCSMHGEEMVMYDRINKQLLCCKCLAIHQLKPDRDTKEIVMADDYCLEWTLKWRQLSQKITQMKETLINRAAINGLLYSQIQNYVIKEALKGRFECKEDNNASPLVITEFAQRIYEAEQLILDYESTGAADNVNQMELAYHLYEEDLNKVSDIMKNSDILRENHLIEIVGRYILCQMDGTDQGIDMYGERTSRNRSVYQNGAESIRSTLDESPDPQEVDDCDEQVQKRPLQKKPPVVKQQQVKIQTPQKGLKSHSQLSKTPTAATASSKALSSTTRNVSNFLKTEDDSTFWENSKDTKSASKAGAPSPSTNMMGLLQSLSSLRIQLRQACHLSETLKQAAIEAEMRGDSFKALELMSETHQNVVKIRSLEQRIEEVKKDIVRTQAVKQEAIKAESRNKFMNQGPRSLSQKRGSSSMSRPYKHIKDLI